MSTGTHSTTQNVGLTNHPVYGIPLEEGLNGIKGRMGRGGGGLTFDGAKIAFNFDCKG